MRGAIPRLPRSRHEPRAILVSRQSLVDRYGRGGGVMAATEILPWHRRHAVMLASQLPEDTLDALIILRLEIELVEGFLAGSDKPEPAKVLTMVRGKE